jgi:hypothetical protein
MLNEHRTARLYIDVRFYYSSAPVHTIVAHTENSMSSAIAASVEVGVFPPAGLHIPQRLSLALGSLSVNR